MNFLHRLSFHMQIIIFRTFFIFLNSVRNVQQTTRNVLPSNQMRSQADLLLHTLLDGNRISNGKEILLKEKSFITFSLPTDQPSYDQNYQQKFFSAFDSF